MVVAGGGEEGLAEGSDGGGEIVGYWEEVGAEEVHCWGRLWLEFGGWIKEL